MTSSVAAAEIPSDTSREDCNDANIYNFRNRINANELYDFYLGKGSYVICGLHPVKQLSLPNKAGNNVISLSQHAELTTLDVWFCQRHT
ncbi:hypothetical protein LOAG_08363 [Loa loa]|uniref:Uncharacterized protein n=1 Tax=Loa loa TaxID=7209 RepID=A0A1S0TVJ9_LOALO|nr:hypothetical protein LOAG_08363 [Loa loa]EFO20125.1 hypothetical protein LOAG_08363 [Loa loa]